MLSCTDIALVRASFARVATIQEATADLFYERLFVIAPKVHALFPADLSKQKRKLMQMITAAVKGLDRLEQLVPVVEDLGRRHTGYGVTDAHYDTVGAALLWTLEMGLGSAFTPEVKEAWTTVYGILASTMKNAAHAEVAAA